MATSGKSPIALAHGFYTFETDDIIGIFFCRGCKNGTDGNVINRKFQRFDSLFYIMRGKTDDRIFA